MNRAGRIGILGDADRVAACATELGGQFEIAVSTADPATLLAQVDAGSLDAAALCNPDVGLAAQLGLAQRILASGVSVAMLRPSVPHGIDGLGLVAGRIGGCPLVFLPAGPVRSAVGPVKRAFDALFAAAVLLLGMVFWLVIALVVKLQDRGPVFFAQERVGAGGRRFRFVKFRTMWPDADRHREWYEKRHGQDGHVFKLRDDPRRTPFGRILRRFSLDEVPQFLHALSGRMSVVGPRPPLVSEVERYEPWQRMRLDGWVGLTGLWQVCGRAEVRNLDDIVLLDALYLRNHSLRLDLRIVLRTVRVVLGSHGAY